MRKVGRKDFLASIVAAGRPVAALAVLVALALASFPPPEAGGGAAGPASEAAPSPPRAARLFRIGYMGTEAPSGLTAGWFKRLKRHLESDAALRKALAAEGFGGIALVAAEGFNDLVRRMDISELQCAFCPAVAFCRQMGDYTVVFQLRGPNDRGRGRYIFRHGVVFVNSRHPLFRPPEKRDQAVPPQIVARHFVSEPVALVSRYSAPGYIYPYNKLLRSGVFTRPARPIFCGSSEEVVKMVLSDVVSMGACEDGAIESVLRRYGVGDGERYYDVLLTTPGCPTDPVVFQKRFRPAGSEAGRRLKEALARFFAADRPGRLRLEESDDSAFEGLREALAEFDQLTAEISSGEAR